MLTGCGSAPSPPRQFQTQQSWELSPGGAIAGYAIVAGLGDISIDLGGSGIYAPFNGELERAPIKQCFVFSSAEVPAYLFRLCGLRRAQVGKVKAGQVIGSGRYLHFAAMRRQPDGTWALVEPSGDILQRILEKP